MPSGYGTVAEGAVSGAATGASIGSVVPGIGTVIGGVAGFVIGGVMGHLRAGSARRERQREERRMRRLTQRLRFLSSPEHFYEEMNKLRAGYREQIAAGPGQSAQQGVRSLVARRGLTGTGIGDTMLAAAEQAPEIEALRQSFQGAHDLVGRQLENEQFAASMRPFQYGLPSAGLSPETRNSIIGTAGLYDLLRDEKPTAFNRGKAPYQTATSPFQNSLFPSSGAGGMTAPPPIDYDSLFQYSAGF